jgi:hypothetical protein
MITTAPLEAATKRETRMAKVAFGGGVAAMSGKLGGSVFAHNKGGSYSRNWKKPTNPNTQSQLDSRDRLVQMSNEWRALTQAQQDAWAAFAATHPILDRLGAAINLTGHQAYVKININRDLAADATAHATVPNDPAFVAGIIDNTTALVIDASTPTLTLALGAGAAADQVLMIYASPAVSAGQNNTASQERLIEVHTLTAGEVTAVSIPLSTPWVAKFGGMAAIAGKKIIVNAYQYDEGQLSAATKVSGIAVA